MESKRESSKQEEQWSRAQCLARLKVKSVKSVKKVKSDPHLGTM